MYLHYVSHDISLHTTGTPTSPGAPNIFQRHKGHVDGGKKQQRRIKWGESLRNKNYYTIFLQLVGSVEVLKSDLSTLGHGLLTLTNPNAGVEVLLVGLVGTIGVTNGGLEVVLLALDVVTDTGQVGVLHVSVDIDLDDTVADGLLVLRLGGTGATVEDEVDGLVRLGAQLLLDVLLVLGEQLGVQTDVTGFVDTVDIAEASGNGEVRADGGEGLLDGQDVLGLGVEGVVVNILVVDTVLLTTGDTDLL